MFSWHNPQKLKINLSLACNRLKLLEKKKTEQAQKARREIADYLSNNKIDRARIRVEHIIREDYMVEALELLEMYCDLLLARFGLIQEMKVLDEGLVEAVSTVVWATPRLQGDINEFKTITEQFQHKYGKELIQEYKANTTSSVNERVMHKLGVHAPPPLLIEKYLIEISKNFNVAFEPDPEIMKQDEVYFADTHYKMNLLEPGEVTGDGTVAPMPALPFENDLSKGPLLPMPDLPSQPFTAIPPPETLYPPQPPAVNQPAESFQLNLPDIPSNNLPGASGGSFGSASENVDFDDLNRRFEELKKKK
ncbi:IST1 homolog [Lineus longissimus]|uniref:IST1 homolog n=1 Tax=Lineus longissimus TaxID=88925 RepID=UPI002B4D6B2E